MPRWRNLVAALVLETNTFWCAGSSPALGTIWKVVLHDPMTIGLILIIKPETTLEMMAKYR